MQINCSSAFFSHSGDKCPDKYAGCNVAVPCSQDLTKQSPDMDHSSDLKKGIMVAESAIRVINANISGNCTMTFFYEKSICLCKSPISYTFTLNV
jgi:hypothetical protein